MERYQFKVLPLGQDHLVEIRIVMPSPSAVAADCIGNDARKRIAKWILSSASGLAQACGVDLARTFHAMFQTLSDQIDRDTWREWVIQHVKKHPIALRELEAHPPAGMDGHSARITAEALVDDGTLILDQDLTLSLRAN